MSQVLDPVTVSQQDAASAAATNSNGRPASSPRKLASARLNGAKSRGPTSPEGRERCAAAAAAQITHGMLAKTVVLHGESESRFIGLLESFTAAYRPITEPEYAAVNKMVVAYWRQMRTWSIQKLDFDREMARTAQTSDPADGPIPTPFLACMAFRALCQDSANVLGLAHRYETTYERQFSRALKDLTHLKAHRDPTVSIEATTSGIGASTWDEPMEEEPMEEDPIPPPPPSDPTETVEDLPPAESPSCAPSNEEPIPPTPASNKTETTATQPPAASPSCPPRNAPSKATPTPAAQKPDFATGSQSQNRTLPKAHPHKK